MSDFSPHGDLVELIQQLIRNRCVNDGSVSSGEEHRNTALLESFLESSGLPIERHTSAPGRDNLVARIEGSDPKAPSLLLMGHTDVVPVNARRWRNDPFGGELIGDEVWGRGAIDMFNLTASMAYAMRELARAGFKPKGSLIYAAVADEEAGGTYGAEHLLKTIPDTVRADYVITESGGFPLPGADGTKLPVLVAEKGINWSRLRITGTPGHGSMPFRTDNALVKAAEVVRRINQYTPATRIHESWRTFVSSMGLPEELTKPLVTEEGFVEAIAGLPLGLSRMAYSCAHTTITPTVMQAGAKLNIIPDTVEVELDVRTLPGDGPAEVAAMIDEALGDLAADVEFLPGKEHGATVSPMDTPLWDTLARVSTRFYADSSIIPLLMVGATDARFFRSAGSVCYGFGMFSRKLTLDDLAQMGHGDDERVDLESLGMISDLWDAVARDLLV
ncbi:MAG TPA: M20/M25/M40 family metallo-hydrolase [Actinomycetota bacterium]|nr:M20/M25/M40 family metallo-hydrolase [Actinomycetota bacterium]